MKLTIVITGASGGIGGAVAKLLHEIGHTVIGTSRHPTRGESPFSVLPLDLSSDASIDQFAKAVTSPVDILINNAALATTHPVLGREEASFGELSRSEFSEILNVNVIGTFMLTRALLEHVAASHSKLIINVGSDMGSVSQNLSGGRVAYRCSKAALHMLTRCLAIDLAPRGIKCIAWHPGWVRTAMGGTEADLSPQQAAASLCKILPKITPEKSGQLLDNQGNPLGW